MNATRNIKSYFAVNTVSIKTFDIKELNYLDEKREAHKTNEFLTEQR